jgi:hypothetical protein
LPQRSFNWHVPKSLSRCQKQRYIEIRVIHRLGYLMFSLLRAKKILMGKAAASATETGSILDAAFTTPPILPSFHAETPIAAMPPPPTDAELDAAWGEGVS